MKSELERHKKALAIAMDDLRFIARQGCEVQGWQQRIELALNPPPEMEEVEVVRWYYPAGDEIVDRAKSPHFGDHELVKLTGTLKRPKPQKVERTWTLEGAALDKESFGAFSHVKVCPFPDGAPLGKIGTLTFTWQE